MAIIRRAGYALIERALRRTFRRIEWIGPFEPPPGDVPLVIAANHHVFHDSYALGWIVERVLHRRAMVWMAEYDRFPFFGLLGAMPLPPDDAGRRAATVRRTVRIMRRQPASGMIYYPEAQLHPADEGVAPFPPERCARLDRVLPPHLWWPVALRLSGHHRSKPTLQLTAAPAAPAAPPDMAGTLAVLLTRLAQSAGAPTRVLLDGRPGPEERWRFGPGAEVRRA